MNESRYKVGDKITTEEFGEVAICDVYYSSDSETFVVEVCPMSIGQHYLMFESDLP